MDRKGQAASTGIVTFIILAMTLMVGGIVFGLFDTAADSLSNTTAAQAAIDNVTLNTYSGFNVVSIGPIVMAAAVILAVVGLLTVGRR